MRTHREVAFSVLLLTLFLTACSTVPGTSPRPIPGVVPQWDFASETKGIKIWTRQIPGNPLKDFRVVMTVDVPISTVVAVITDVNTTPDWFWMMDKASVLEGTRLDNAVLYYSLQPIWPTRARDAVVRATVYQDPKTLTVNIDFKADPAYMPRAPGHVRVPAMNSSFRLTPVTRYQTRIEMIGNADPGGSVPKWLANTVVTIMPRESFSKLRTLLLGDEYRYPERLYVKNTMLKDLMRRISIP